jgi:hypothetical protein
LETIHLNLATNTASYNGKHVTFTRRYEAAFLACLALQQARAPKTAVDQKTVNRVLIGLGQKQTLIRKQYERLLESVEAGLQALGLPEAFTRIEHPPQHRTTGAWWWKGSTHFTFDIPHRDRIESDIAPPDPMDQETPQGFKIATDGSLAATRSLLWKLFYADAHAWDGDFFLVTENLENTPGWKTASTDTKIQFHLRLARSHKVLREFEESAHHFSEARRLANTSPALQAMHTAQIDHHVERERYNQNPVASAPTIRKNLTGEIHQLIWGAKPSINPWLLGASYNLRGLTLRRAIEGLPDDAKPATRNKLIEVCLSDFISGLYCLLTTRDFETTQNITSNIAYAVQKIALRGWLPKGKGSAPAGEEVFDWYRLTFAWHERFGLADNTAWEYIFLGEYWLTAKDERKNFEQKEAPPPKEKKSAIKSGNTPNTKRQPDHIAHPIWQGKHPHELGFYEHAFHRAEVIGDSRQMLYASLNLYKFADEFHRYAAKARAMEKIQAVTHKHPELVEILTDEGYEIPTSEPTKPRKQARKK